jgi:hypothetical protein
MADTDEEQLLSGLLREVAREDAALDAAHLENRLTTSAWNGRLATSRQWSSRVMVACAIAAAAAVTLTSAIMLQRQRTPTPADARDVQQSVPAVSPEPAPPAGEDVTGKPAVTRLPARSEITQSPPGSALPASHSPAAQSQLEFVPLMPFSGQDLAGPFQIMRVQMPRASLGPPLSPFEHPHELIQADVLLGEDGMARAIRVPASGSSFLWRSR